MRFKLYTSISAIVFFPQFSDVQFLKDDWVLNTILPKLDFVKFDFINRNSLNNQKRLVQNNQVAMLFE